MSTEDQRAALIRAWENSLPEPFRGYVHQLATNADPSGNIRDAVCQRENARALAEKLRLIGEAHGRLFDKLDPCYGYADFAEDVAGVLNGRTAGPLA